MMKQYWHAWIFLLAMVACSKDNSDPAPVFPMEYAIPSRPSAMAAHNNDSYGIYKGVSISAAANSATIQFNLYNDHPEPYALLYRDGKIVDSLVRYQVDSYGNFVFPYRRETAPVPFNTTFNGAHFASYRDGIGAAAWLSTIGSGTAPNMGVNMDVNATLDAVLKEKSDKQVFCFEGAYSGADSGRIAFVVRSDSVLAIRSSIWNPQFFKIMKAAINNNQFKLAQFDDIGGNDFEFLGTVQNDRCTGSWTKNAGPAGTNVFLARRTL
jgi:hypothetical protein